MIVNRHKVPINIGKYLLCLYFYKYFYIYLLYLYLKFLSYSCFYIKCLFLCPLKYTIVTFTYLLSSIFKTIFFFPVPSTLAEIFIFQILLWNRYFLCVGRNLHSSQIKVLHSSQTSHYLSKSNPQFSN